MDADSNVPFALKEYFGKDALSFIPQIETRYYRVLFALGQSYMYHCAYADEKRRQMYLGKCGTGVWAETSQDEPRDISVCVPNFVDKCDDFVRAAVIIHESIHRLGMFDEGQGHAKRFRSGCAFEGSVAGSETRGYLWNCDSYAAFALWSSRSGY